MADRADIYACAIGYALVRAAVPATADLYLLDRAGGMAGAVAGRLAEGRTVRVVSDESEALGPARDGSPVVGNGVLVAFGPLTDADHGYRVRVAVYASMRDATTGDYEVQRSGAGWRVTAA